MENVSHLFLFKGKLQTQNSISPKMCSLPATLPFMPDMPFHPRGPHPNLPPPVFLLLSAENEWLLVSVPMTKLVATPLTQTQRRRFLVRKFPLSSFFVLFSTYF